MRNHFIYFGLFKKFFIIFSEKFQINIFKKSCSENTEENFLNNFTYIWEARQ